MRNTFAAIILSQLLPLGASATQFTPIPTTMVDGKKCMSIIGGGVQCPGEGPKCISPCRGSTSGKDDRAVCEPALVC